MQSELACNGTPLSASNNNGLNPGHTSIQAWAKICGFRAALQVPCFLSQVLDALQCMIWPTVDLHCTRGSTHRSLRHRTWTVQLTYKHTIGHVHQCDAWLSHSECKTDVDLHVLHLHLSCSPLSMILHLPCFFESFPPSYLQLLQDLKQGSWRQEREDCNYM